MLVRGEIDRSGRSFCAGSASNQVLPSNSGGERAALETLRDHWRLQIARSVWTAVASAPPFGRDVAGVRNIEFCLTGSFPARRGGIHAEFLRLANQRNASAEIPFAEKQEQHHDDQRKTDAAGHTQACRASARCACRRLFRLDPLNL